MQIDKDVLMFGLQVLMGIIGFIIALIVRRLGEVMQGIKKDHERLAAKLELHREDVLKNYVTSSDLTFVKDDIIRNIKSLEETMIALVGRRKTDKD